ncbi:MAG: helix-turn-helix transcriptional regulator [Chitinophagaceae bacterium]|nr:helix-turn-helix transcriptional regulator [Chitinophagaceae bacterium]
MNEDLILLLGEKIKSKRLQKRITMDALSRRAGVSKGLISQIENNRTVPSLPVLFNIIQSLEEDIKSFFDDMHDHFSNGHVMIIQKGEAKPFKKEPVPGFVYKRVLTKSINTQAIDFVLLELKKGASRKLMIRTEAYECKYILRGTIEYQIEKQRFILKAGDTLFFDGRAKHRLKNVGNGEALIFVTYLF